jgi:copper chaperone CopZ
MKKIIIALFTLVFAGSVMAQTNEGKVTFYVNFHCANCIQKVNKNFTHERGVRNFKTDLKGLRIDINYNPRRTNPESLRKAIEKLGFTVRDSHAEILKVPGVC